MVATPPFRNPDEPGHYMRVMGYAHGARWTPFEGKAGYLDFYHAANNVRPYMTGKPVVYSWELLMPVLAAGQEPEAEKMTMMQSRGPTVSLYSPVAYLPAIVSTWLLDAMSFSPVVIFYAMRLSLLLASCLLIAWAIKRIAYAPWVIVAAMLWPVASCSRGMVTADSMTTAFALAFVAVALSEKRPVVLLLALALAVSLSKIIFVIMLLLLLVPRASYVSHALVGVIATVAAVVWNMQAGKALQAAIDRGTSLVSNPAEQVAFLKEHPLHFLTALGETMSPMHFWLIELGKSAVGIIGELDIRLPVWVCVWVVAGTFALLFLRNRQDAAPRGWIRLVAITIFLGCFVGTMLALFVQWNAVGATTISGFQGRYMLPVLPLLLIAIMPPRGLRVPSYVLPLLVLLIAVAGNVSGVVAMVHASYYG